MHPSTANSTSWQDVMNALERETDRIWLDEPLEITKIRLGVIDTGAGTGGQSFSVLVHTEAFLMIVGCNMLFRLIRSAKNDDLQLSQLTKLTKLLLQKPFNIFEFMGDCSLHDLHRLGNDYLAALDTLATNEDYVALTGSMFTYVERLHRWIHFIFPWHIGTAFPHRNLADLALFVRQADLADANQH